MYEQVFAGDSTVEEIRKMILKYEAVREDAAVWFDVVADELSQGHRPIFAAKFGKRVIGYMILKPRDLKISSIFIEPGSRGKGYAAALYGMGSVNLGTSQPYTAFVHDMIDEFRTLIRTHSLVLDDTGPLCVLNPGDGYNEIWAAPAPEPVRAVHAAKPAKTGGPVRPAVAAYGKINSLARR